MFFNYPELGAFVFGIGYIVVFGAIIFVTVVAVRLMFAATRALNAVTREKEFRIDLLIAGEDPSEK
ncbi:MAG TPA: hypothetical protein VGP24_17890 [Glaciihabitans sp.]|jgi:hypothetical protein|nr:hypothetical protein [Glaciihabitans sp.]